MKVVCRMKPYLKITKVFNININVSFQLCPILLNVHYTVPDAVDRSESLTVYLGVCV